MAKRLASRDGARRADLVLVDRGLFESRAKAQEAIAAGLVRADGAIVRKASEPVAAAAKLEAARPYPWLSRGGVKLAAALDAFDFDPAGRVCLDIGASTGGFTDVLARGAAHVYAVDVGHDQLHMKLKADPRVTSWEGFDARRLAPAAFDRPVFFLTCDVSFISLKLVLPCVLPLAIRPGALLITLVKPHFEAGPAHVVKGRVREAAVRTRVCMEIENLIATAGWHVAGRIASPIAGGDGNCEYLVGASRA